MVRIWLLAIIETVLFGRGAVSDRQLCEGESALEAGQIGPVHEIGQQVCGRESRLGVV